MAVTVVQFQEDFPQFASTDDFTIESAIATAELMADRTVWGTLADRAQALLTAHILTIREQSVTTSGSATGSMVGMTIPNELQLQFAPASGSTSAGNDGLAATAYGREFLQLQKFVIFPFRIF